MHVAESRSHSSTLLLCVSSVLIVTKHDGDDCNDARSRHTTHTTTQQPNHPLYKSHNSLYAILAVGKSIIGAIQCPMFVGSRVDSRSFLVGARKILLHAVFAAVIKMYGLRSSSAAAVTLASTSACICNVMCSTTIYT